MELIILFIFIGLTLNWNAKLKRRIGELEAQFSALAEKVGSLSGQTRQAGVEDPAEAPSPVAAVPTPALREPVLQARVQRPAAPEAPAVSAVPEAPAPIAPAAPAPPPVRVKREPTPPPAWLVAIRTWLFTGNLVAKLGLLILFIGVSFLLKYAAERVTVPIELRIAGIVLADIALLAWGWRMRDTRRNLSLPIQGTALAIMMLVTFGAFRLYHLIPANLAFALLFILTVFTCLLAVMQNAVWLAVFGIAGGFVSPILTSTGQGSHVALFSYYSLLNAGIVGIAWKRTWRSLNLLGFGFTFLIGTAWGLRSYDPALHYASVQFFLVVFFLFYVAIALLYAKRQMDQDKPAVDATIVFGTALAAFSLQLALMKDVAFGNAFSALAFGAFYTVLALALWRQRGQKTKLMVECFLALGVVFGTLAIPFAVDSRWTSAAWALEGAGVVWVGLRQRQRQTYLFGLLVQAGAWISFIASMVGLGPQSARESNIWLGFLLLAGTAFFMATTFRAQKDDEANEQFPRMGAFFLAGAAIWLMAGAWAEIMLRHAEGAMTNLLAASGLAVAALLAFIAIRMRWQFARTLSLVAQVVAGVTVLVLMLTTFRSLFFTHELFNEPFLGALLIFAGAVFTSFNMWRNPLDVDTRRASNMMLGWSAFWWLGPVLVPMSGTTCALLQAAMGMTSLGVAWPATYLLLVALSSAVFARAAIKLAWDKLRWLSVPAWPALAMATLLAWGVLYGDQHFPPAILWAAFGVAWCSSEWLLRTWRLQGWRLPGAPLKLIHLVRIAGPWVILWKVGELAIDGWLAGDMADQALLADSGITFSASWSGFLPFWALMLVLAWLIKRSATEQWPVAPLAGWYRRTLIPAAVAWSLLLTMIWNVAQDGAMAPLPYVPVLNPLDLSTAFALMAAIFCYRMLKADSKDDAPMRKAAIAKLPVALGLWAYAWFNLILLRTAAQVLDIAYQAGPLFDSLFIQAMLSLVWSISALVLMRQAVKKTSRAQWMVGAGLLALVVLKLVMVDLAGTGSVARIVSFVGVGLLMVLIGYLAPYPTSSSADDGAAPTGA